jgi:hypothetical protein
MSFPYLIISDPRQVESSKHVNGYRGYRRPATHRPYQGVQTLLQLIPRDEWPARIAAPAGSTLPSTYRLPAKDQDGLRYCWVYGSTRAVEIERAILGLSYLELAPESVGGPLTHFRDEGGYASEAFQQIEAFGICEESFLDAPCSLDVDRWKQGWRQNALTHETVDWIDVEPSDAFPTFDQVVTALLQGHPVAAGLPWWSHLVCFLSPIVLPPNTAPANCPDGSTVGILFQNSWGPDWPTPGANGYAVLTEQLATTDGAAVPLIAT